jgi:hypothetical protein
MKSAKQHNFLVCSVGIIDGGDLEAHGWDGRSSVTIGSGN